MTRVVAIGSGKGGVGRSWLTAPFPPRRRTSPAARDIDGLARHLALAG